MKEIDEANPDLLLHLTTTVSFADVAHQMLIFHSNRSAERLVLELIDTKWMQRLRDIRQTGNTHLVYMFAEHSRFGHSLGVAYLSLLLMRSLRRHSPEMVEPYEHAVAAAALLHDIGHVAPGSHLAEKIWAPEDGSRGMLNHEKVSARVILGDPEIRSILERYDPKLPDLVVKILFGDPNLPAWTHAIISGDGWNADRGNWAIVDSAMCSVSYGRYNVSALIDAFRLSPRGDLVLLENRLDALTHFFVARDSMYRQVYQHRVLQSVDALSGKIVLRLRDLTIEAGSDPAGIRSALEKGSVFADQTLVELLAVSDFTAELPIETIFKVTESWWRYHLNLWCDCGDAVLADLSRRLRDRRLFKTVRLRTGTETGAGADRLEQKIVADAQAHAQAEGSDPRYYVSVVNDSDRHRKDIESPPMVLLDNGEIVPVTEVEPIIAELLRPAPQSKRWLVVPKTVKEKLRRIR